MFLIMMTYFAILAHFLHVPPPLVVLLVPILIVAIGYLVFKLIAKKP